MDSGNQVIYIPEYVEQGVSKLQDAKNTLEEITTQIEAGIATINSSGYNRGIPHIEKGDTVSTALGQMKSTIATITTQIEKYSNGEAIELENAIIIADPATASKYGLKEEDIDYTLSEYLFGSNVSGKWSEDYLQASQGFIKYVTSSGRIAKETWCDLDPDNLAKLMKDQGYDLDYWIREDGVYMYGDYVMVAADIPHMDGTEQAAEYRKGDLVETSLGTGIVVDLCGMAEDVRKGNIGGADSDVGVWYDIYTAWHDGGQYQHVGYCDDANCESHYHGSSTMIKKSGNTSTKEVNTATLAGTGVSGKSTTQFRTVSDKEEKTEEKEETEKSTVAASLANATNAPKDTEQTSSNKNTSSDSNYSDQTSSNKNTSSGSSYGNESSSNKNTSSGSSYGSQSSSSSSGSNYINSSTQNNSSSSTTPKVDPTKPEIVEKPKVEETVVTTPIVENNTTPQQNWSPQTQAPVTQPIVQNNNVNQQATTIETTPVIVEPTPEPTTTIINNNQNTVEKVYIPSDKNIEPQTETISTETTRKSINVIPVVAGLGASVVAGLGAKAYIENKEETEEKEKKDSKNEDIELDINDNRIMEIG